MEEKFYKIAFTLDHADWHGRCGEDLWAVPKYEDESGSLFYLRSTPFFTTSVSKLDVVRAVASGDNSTFVFAGVERRGGHSTYMVLAEPERIDADKYLRRLVALNCGLEATKIKLSIGERILFSIDVPADVDVYEAYEVLEQAEKASVWLFQEGNVGHKLKI